MKKLSVKDIRSRISKMIKEEFEAALLEEINPILQKVQDKNEFIAWIMRQYFDPKKHGDKLWYSPKVNEKNVLLYVSNPSNHFPLTPREVADMWRTKKSLSASMAMIPPSELEAVEEEEEEKEKYQTGEETLKTIGKELGGLTPTMINKLATSGMEKIRKLTKGTHPEEMSPETWEALINAIYNARIEAAVEFAKDLKEVRGNIKDFLQVLLKKQILTPTDIKIISQKEVESLVLLSQYPEEQIHDVLLADIERDDNVFKSYQSAVSKRIFPPGKRGRPPKKPS